MEGKVSPEAVEKALSYLDSFEKGITGEGNSGPAPGFDQSTTTNGERQKLQKAKREKHLNYHLQKAKAHQEALEKMAKGEDVEDVDKEDDEVVEKCDMKKAICPTPGAAVNPDAVEPATGNKAGEKEVTKPAGVPDGESGLTAGSQREENHIKKGLEDNIGGMNQSQVDLLIKGAVSSALGEMKGHYDTLLKSKDEQIADFNSRLEKIESQPMPKSIRKGADAIVLQKALSGEPTAEGKTLLSKSLQKGKVSNAIYSAFESCDDPVMKGQLGNAVSVFEATPEGVLTSDVAKYLYDKHNINIIA